MKKSLVFTLFLSSALLLSACGAGASAAAAAEPVTETATPAAQTAAPAPTDAVTADDADYNEDMFTARDLRDSYDEADCVRITLNGAGAVCDSDAVTVDGGTVTISAEGSYILSGTLADGMILVDVDSSEKVQLILDGADVTSATAAALYVRQADKVFLTLAEGSQNRLANGGSFSAIDDSNLDAALFSADDLTINGSGSLSIVSPAGHGVAAKDDLVLAGGALTIDAAGHGLDANDSVRIAGGSLTVTAGKDGIHAENGDDTSLGFVYVGDGSLSIAADGDGISGAAYVTIDGGSFSIVTAGGSANAPVKNDGFGMGGRGFPGSAEATTTEDTTSCKGIKATGDLTINAGDVAVDAYDDALHCNANLYVNGGVLTLASGDDGMHADTCLTIAAGNVTVTKSYEGIESQQIDILDGTIRVTSSDDGINAGGGADSSGFGGWDPSADAFSTGSSCYLSIHGGSIVVDSEGDGLDANGSLLVSGGVVFVAGPTATGNGALDSDGSAVISGGCVIAVDAGGMAMNFGGSSTQGSILASSGSQVAGSEITLTDANGAVLLQWTSPKTYTAVVVSCPELIVGGTYTLTAGSYSQPVTLSTLVYGSSGGMGGGRMH